MRASLLPTEKEHTFSLYEAAKNGGEPDEQGYTQFPPQIFPAMACRVLKQCGDGGITAEIEHGDDVAHSETHAADSIYSLFNVCGATPFLISASDLGVAKVELEDVEEAGDASAESMGRLEAIVWPMIPTGVATWTLAVGGGFLAGYTADCEVGASPLFFIFPALAACVQIYMDYYLLQLLSSTFVEERDTCKSITSFKGMDAMPIQVGASLADMFGRYSRALFVGFVLNCVQDNIDDAFSDSFVHSPLRFMVPLIQFIGFGGLTVISFVVGPIVIQGGYMIWSYRKVNAEMKSCRERSLANDESLGAIAIFGPLQAVADWAMLNPVGKVLAMMSLPPSLEDLNDAYRVWVSIRTENWVTLARILPDNICQVFLQTRFLSLTYPSLDMSIIAMTLVNIVLASADTLDGATTLLKRNRYLTVLSGSLLLLLMVDPIVRTAGVFLCGSHVINLSSLSCLPAGLVHYGNFTDVGVGAG